MTAYIFLICLSYISKEIKSVRGWDTTLTTRGFKGIFLKRCKDFGELQRTPEIYQKNSFDDTNCLELWESFKNAVGHENPCEITMATYQQFIDAANGRLDERKIKSGETFKDKVTFWSGTKDYADGISRSPNSKYLTLGSLFQGYVVDVPNLSWCGDAEDDQGDGFKYQENAHDKTNCTGQTKTGRKNCNPVEHYWNAMSVDLGILSSGKTYVVLSAHSSQRINGKIRPAYTRDSVFATYELPQLKKNKDVTSLEVIAILPFEKTVSRASCNGKNGEDKSLVDLKEDAEKGDSVFKEALKTYTCIDPPESEEFKKDLCRLTEDADIKSKCRRMNY